MAKDELRLIEDALIDDILNASAEETVADLREHGIEPGTAEALMDRMVAEAVGMARAQRLDAAKEKAAKFRTGASGASAPISRAAAQDRMRALRAGSAGSGMMLAARKGAGMSERDEESLAEDLAELDRLRSEDGEA